MPQKRSMIQECIAKLHFHLLAHFYRLVIIKIEESIEWN